MLHDLVYQPGRSGIAQPKFFNAALKNGILNVPPFHREAA